MEYGFAMRRATPGDREAVVALCNAISDRDWVPHEYHRLMEETEPRGLYLAESAGDLVGIYHLDLTTPTEAYFSAMRISPAHQGRGIGSQFCRAQIEQALSVGATRIYLLSQIENQPAHRTVTRNGFRNLGPWLIYGEITRIPDLGSPRRAREARPEDMAGVASLVKRSRTSEVDDLICIPETVYVLREMQPQDWEIGSTLVAEGEGGLVGALLYSLDGGWLSVRRLLGGAPVAHDLLALLRKRTSHLELEGWSVGLPAHVEPWLQPLELDPSEAFRSYVFRLRTRDQQNLG